MKTTSAAQGKLRSLPREKAELVRLLVARRSARQSAGIEPYPRPETAGSVRLPTSWAQQRLWFIDWMEGASRAYNLQFVARIVGPLHEDSLRRALDTIVQRHETLRTVFVSEDGSPVQEIAAQGRLTLQIIDLDGRDESERERQVHANKVEDARTAFDLGTGPLIRGRLLRLGADERVLLITLHHIISDFWSGGLLLRELAELYAAYRGGRDDPLPPLPVQYADYAQWQRQWLCGEVLDKQLDYWRMHLQGATPELKLPADRRRPAVQSYRGDMFGIALDASLTAAVKAFARCQGMTLFMVLQAAWSVLMHRLSGQEDIVSGTPIANRQRQELEGLIGFFVNTLALRVCVRPDVSVRDLLAQVREVTLKAYEHQDIPFERVVEALQPQRSLSMHPIFQVAFGLQNTPYSEPKLEGLTIRREEHVFESAIFDLHVLMREQGGEIVGHVAYAIDLFDRKTVERWISSFKVLLAAMVANAEMRVGELPLLDDSARRELLEQFNATRVEYPQGKLMHQLIEEQALRTPNAIAVIHGDQSLTYEDLDSRANRLSWHLRDKGAGRNVPVGICMERGLDMVIGLLGILKAGAPYVSLDPCYPAQRLEHILRDASPTVLLTQERLRTSLPQTSAEIVTLDGHWAEIAKCASICPDPRASGLHAGDLAYLIYTSGSTGLPKGVAIEHRNAVNFLCWARAETPDEELSETLFSTSLNFDLSVYECFVPLSAGGTVRVVDNALALLESSPPVTLINTVPSAIAALVEHGAVPVTVRTINLAGEPLKQELVERIFRGSGVGKIRNLYGPSETTTYSTWVSMTREAGFDPTIGRPIANTLIYILDARRQLVPVGVPGEIYIGGAGVARGYLNRPELTAERFVPNPFDADPAGRMYGTGDLGRWLPDGTIEYVGRNDHQVKIRGFRVEPGEIEAQLLRHPGLREAVVVAREESPGDKRLVAYVARRAESAVGVDELREHLQAVLPEHMVPGAFVILEGLPLTPNGKVDRSALHAPPAEAHSRQPHVAPIGNIEERLASVWRELLRVERVGRHDNFFELGGHSLLAMRLIARVRDALGVQVSPKLLFAAPTLAGFAKGLDALRWLRQSTPDPAVSDASAEEGVI